MTGLPASDHRIRGAAIDALGRRRVTAEALAAELQAAGIDLGLVGVERLEDLLDGSSEFVELDDGWVGVAAQLDGTRWITKVHLDEAKTGALPLDPDLALLGWWLLDTTVTLGETGQPLEADDDLNGNDVLVGPPGWLEAYAGAYVEVRIVGTSLHLAVAGEATAPTAMTEAVRATFGRLAHFEELRDVFSEDAIDLTQTSVEDLLWEALVTNHDVFTAQPIPPIDSLITAAGLRRENNTVLRGDADVGALHRWYRRNRLASVYGLEDEQVDWAEFVIAMSDTTIAGLAEPFEVDEQGVTAAMAFTVALDDPAVCRALLGHHLEEETEPGALAAFARSIIDGVPPDDAAGVRWLEGRALDLGGDPHGAWAAFTSAVAAGEDHPLALIGLAGFVADSGDAPSAAALLRRAGVDSEDGADDVPGGDEAFDLFLEVAGYGRHRPPAQAGRNDRCPCGSGRKYKACHLGKERHPLVDRGPWLYAKHHRYVRDHDRRLVALLAQEVAVASGHGGLMLDLLDSELIADVALREGGLAESFVAERDEVLPDDEALLAARWQLVERSLFEVDEAGPTHLILRDLRTGEHITVTNTNADSHTRRGQLMLGRPLPVGDTWRAYSGFVPVGGQLRDAILDALDRQDPFEIAELIGRCFAPPRMENTDGEPLEFHELVWNLPDPEAARRALGTHGALTEDDGTFVLVRDSRNQQQTVILTLTITGNELHGSVNSDRRADEVIGLVRSLIPEAELIDHDIRELDEAMEAQRGAGIAPPPNLLDDPEMADLREEIAAEQERRWLDDHVPALGGRTPREAALDPIGRVELERLLDSFGDGAGLMDVARIRKALGL